MAISYTVVDAEPLDLFLGVCKPCRRPNRETETGYPLSTWADKHDATCPECNRPVKMERVYGVEVGMSCDDRCMGATGTHCECACGGVNHGGIWSMEDEVLATALAQYRATCAKREANAVARKASKQEQRLEAFTAWCQAAPQKELVEYLRAYWRASKAGTERYPNRFLDSLCEWLSEHKKLTDNQLASGMRTMQRRQAMERNVAERRKQWQAESEATPESDSSPAKLTTEGATLGLFRWRGDVYLCRPNKAGTRSYASKVVEIASDRLNENGDKVNFKFEYAPGVLARLTEEDRMPVDDMKAFLLRYGKCINPRCRRGLKKAKSVERMMGPVCWKKYGPKVSASA